MFEKIFDHIRGYGKRSEESIKEISEGQRDAQNYYDTATENITAIVANALSILAFGDSSLYVNSNGRESMRSRYLNELAKQEFCKAKRKVSAALGVGMIASIPYSVDNGLGRKIYIDTITKDRFFITGMQGDEITEITAISDIYEDEDGKVLRLTDYSVKDGVYTITNRAVTTKGDNILLSRIKRWENIEPKVCIGGVTKLPVAFYSCPIGARHVDSKFGVPITYGCEVTIGKILKTLDDIEREFSLKKIKVIAPRSLFTMERDAKGRVIGKGFSEELYEKVADNDFENQITVFNPEIRESSYFKKLTEHFMMLEKEIGCSRGILTDMITRDATATEMRAAMKSTFCIIDDLRKEYMKYFEELLYGVSVLLNFYNLTPISPYSVNYEWSYNFLEETKDTFEEMLDAKAEGAISRVELRRFLKPEESPEEAERAVREIGEE